MLRLTEEDAGSDVGFQQAKIVAQLLSILDILDSSEEVKLDRYSKFFNMEFKGTPLHREFVYINAVLGRTAQMLFNSYLEKSCF